jgi:hypothetical protein
MYLRDRACRKGPAFDLFEGLPPGLRRGVLDLFQDGREGQGFNLFLEGAQFLDVFGGHDVRPRGEHLAEFDEGWAEFLQSAPEAGSGLFLLAYGLTFKYAVPRRKEPPQAAAIHKVGEAVSHEDAGNFRQAPHPAERASYAAYFQALLLADYSPGAGRAVKGKPVSRCPAGPV